MRNSFVLIISHLRSPLLSQGKMVKCTENKKICLIIIDGWGISEESNDSIQVGNLVLPSNAIKIAKTPTMDYLTKEYSHCKLVAHGGAVGLPEGLMGNSEVGHLNIGAGRVVYQDIVRIDIAIEDGSMQENAAVQAAFNYAKNGTGRLHLIGLVSDGGVHSHINHLFSLLNYAKAAQVPQIFIHAITDGRDTAPRSATGFLQQLIGKLDENNLGQLVTVVGRYYAMDRDKRWERTKVAFDAMAAGSGQRINSSEELFEQIQIKYQSIPPQTDEFFEPMIINADGNIRDGDSVIFFNYRSDRMRQIVSSIGAPGVERLNFEAASFPKNVMVTCMTTYSPDFTFPVISPPQSLENVLTEWLSKQSIGQLHVAETEKYAHVTFFFNGGREVTFPGEDRVLVASPKVATYDLKPEMSVHEVTDEVIKGMRSNKYPFVMCNFAPPDMVGHTGKFEPTVQAVQHTDEAIRKVFDACQQLGYVLAITADHGNAEKMRSDDGGEHTAHTCDPVPFVITCRDLQLKNGSLCDVAPTILELMGIPIPSEMTGSPLL